MLNAMASRSATVSAVGRALSQGFEREKQERQQAEAFHNDGGKNQTAQA
jgi:hypothetical protein